MRKWIKSLFCKHSHAWIFYPEAWFKEKKTHGLKITACWECGRIINVEDYAR